MSQSYALRVDGDDSAKLAAVLAPLGAYIIAREKAKHGGNVHMHALLHTDENIKNVRNRIVRAYPGQGGNGWYSLTKCQDVDKYERYLCKGDDDAEGPEIVGRQGIQFTDTWVAEKHKLFWDVHAQLLAASKKRKVPVFDRVFQQCVDDRVSWRDDEAIAKKYIKALSEDAKGINLFAVRSQINLLKVRLCPNDDAIEALAVAVASRQ